MDIYIKASKKVSIYKAGPVKLSQIAEIYAKPEVKQKCGDIVVCTLKKDSARHRVLSIISIISAISRLYPNASVNNTGESDIVLEFAPKEKSPNKFSQAIKVIIVCIILFAGASTAIMSFHSDSQMKTAFEKYYHIFFNERVESPAIICFPYSIGLSLGIIVFFNHIFGKSLTDDPTPIQVEMSSYEKDVEDNIIQTQSSNTRGEN